MLTTTTGSFAIAATILLVTLASVWYISFRPVSIELSEDGRTARLVSMVGSELHKWTGERSDGLRDGIRFAKLMNHNEGGKVAILGFSSVAVSRYAGRLCAFFASDPEQLLWSKTITSQDIATSPLWDGFKPAQFGIGWASAIDVFPQNPGEEIVVTHDSSTAAQAIRIYSTDGEVRYQTWHNGTLQPGCWLSTPQQLVFCGLNSAASWKQRGSDGIKSYPKIVFGVNPRLDSLGTAWLTTADSACRWYRCLFPPKASDLLVYPPVNALTPASDLHARLSFQFQADRTMGFSMVLDETGTEVDPKRRGPSDAITDNGVEIDDFKLRDLPPITK